MRSRGLVVAIAVVLAVAAAAAVILYTQGVREEARVGGELETVIVATRTIPANTPLAPLVEQEVFTQVEVPRSTLVDGVVTDISDLQGATTTSTILANEQITSSRLSTGTRVNDLGISAEHIAVTVELEAPQGGSGHIKPGDNVSVFATYQNVQAITGDLGAALNNPAGAPSTAGAKVDLPDFTVTLIPTVRVLAIENPAVDAETGETSDSDRIRITLDLEKTDAQDLVFAQENGLVWIGLLPPDEQGREIRPSLVPVEMLLRRQGQG
jgi:Flp pilus assembly protein CpaB